MKSRKRVLLIAYHCASDDCVGALRPAAMAKYLPQNGIDVTVLAGRNQSEDVVIECDRIWVRDLTRETLTVPIYYAWRVLLMALRAAGIYVGIHSFWHRKILQHADAIIQAVRPDYIMVTYPPVEALEAGLTLAKKYHIPLIADFRDGLMFEPLEMNSLRYRAVRQHYEKIERQVVDVARLVLAVSEPVSTYIRENYRHRNVLTLHNGFDQEAEMSNETIDLALGKTHVIHTGRLGASRIGTSGKNYGIAALARALELLIQRDPQIAQTLQIHFVGYLLSSELETLAPMMQLGIIRCWGHVPRRQALALQRAANVLLLITVPDKASVATGKLFEYLFANKPILALTRGTEAARIIELANAGIIVAPDSTKEIADAIELVTRATFRFNPSNSVIATFSRDRQMTLLAEQIMCLDHE